MGNIHMTDNQHKTQQSKTKKNIHNEMNTCNCQSENKKKQKKQTKKNKNVQIQSPPKVKVSMIS